MLMNMLLSWAAAALGLFVASRAIRGVQLASFTDAVWAGALVGVLQWLLTGPLWVLFGIGTLGIALLFWFLTRWVIAAVVILIASKVSSRLEVSGFFPALITAFLIAAAGVVVRFLSS
jgi:uncharacterized membrane protein YvlD (DUF360 family)